MKETKFKDTEIGKIPQDWETYRLDDLFNFGNGYTPSKSNPNFWNNGTIPWFRMEDIRLHGHILFDSIQHITEIAVKKTLFPAYSIIIST
ncbi:MAG: restriction endonuclease subunit S, partial [Bacteroidota bacterium]|nr:restriction endonuclease subunit S [Bacteroidota bacterium]